MFLDGKIQKPKPSSFLMAPKHENVDLDGIELAVAVEGDVDGDAGHVHYLTD